MNLPKFVPSSILAALSIFLCACGAHVFAEDVSPKEIAEWRKDAELGDAESQQLLGWAYQFGQCVAQDGAEAVKWLRKAAEQNHGLAQAQLGVMYVAGMGIPKDLEEGVKWVRKSAEQGNDLGQVSLGCFYRDGEGVPKDDGESFNWFKKSATQGNRDAQRALGICYSKGKGVSKNPVEAAKWLEKAAQQGQAKAQFDIAYCYVKGEGVPSDDVVAYMWFNLSAAAGIEPAETARDKMTTFLTREQIAEGQKMSREWKPKKEFIHVQEVTDAAKLEQSSNPTNTPATGKKRDIFDELEFEPSPVPQPHQE